MRVHLLLNVLNAICLLQGGLANRPYPSAGTPLQQPRDPRMSINFLTGSDNHNPQNRRPGGNPPPTPGARRGRTENRPTGTTPKRIRRPKSYTEADAEQARLPSEQGKSLLIFLNAQSPEDFVKAHRALRIKENPYSRAESNSSYQAFAKRQRIANFLEKNPMLIQELPELISSVVPNDRSGWRSATLFAMTDLYKKGKYSYKDPTSVSTEDLKAALVAYSQYLKSRSSKRRP